MSIRLLRSFSNLSSVIVRIVSMCVILPDQKIARLLFKTMIKRFPDMELDIVLYILFIFHVFFAMCLLALVDDQSSNKGGFIWSTCKMTTYWTNHLVKALWHRNIVVFTTWPYIEVSIFSHFWGGPFETNNPVWDTCAFKRSVT